MSAFPENHTTEEINANEVVTEPREPDIPVATDVPLDIEESDDHEGPDDWEDYFPIGLVDSENDNLEDDVTGSSDTFNIEAVREDTRGRLAIIYTVATFSMFILGFVAALVESIARGTSLIENLSAILPLISGIFLGSLGFVLGHYFRRDEGN